MHTPGYPLYHNNLSARSDLVKLHLCPNQTKLITRADGGGSNNKWPFPSHTHSQPFLCIDHFSFFHHFSPVLSVYIVTVLPASQFGDITVSRERRLAGQTLQNITHQFFLRNLHFNNPNSLNWFLFWFIQHIRTSKQRGEKICSKKKIATPVCN